MEERVPMHPGQPAKPAPHAAEGPMDWKHDPRTIQILTAEHWGLLAGRSLSWNESFSRAGMFLTAVSGAVVALALVGQSTAYSREFVAFALILLPVVLFIGLTTVARLSQVNSVDLVYLQAMNRLRHAYLELVPEVAPYFSTSSHDDLPSTFFSAFTLGLKGNPLVQGLVTTPALVSVICSVLTGVIAAIVASQLGAALGLSIAGGVFGFVACMVALTAYRSRAFDAFARSVEVRFPPVT